MKQTSLLFTLLIIIFYSCNNNETSVEYLYPTDIGNNWSYKHERYISDSLIFDQDITIEVIGRKEINGYDCLIFEEQNETKKGERYYTFSENKFLFVGRNYYGFSPIFHLPNHQSNLRIENELFPADSCPVVYDYPLVNNKTWEVINHSNLEVKRIKKVIGDTSITVPAGTFLCKHIHTTDNMGGAFHEFINKEIGLVKKEFLYTNILTDYYGDIVYNKKYRFIDVLEEYNF
ncbi:hypothetical protein KMW28_17510 [Flammeovirga yaeyamensis]|uniref:DKNYY family protein n=1 Tax=Flammeovirga yaeyamensis TaxID=367791 RepID=A0AAX1N2G9_9BACT|nr:hypothetical protein [Flammeovirga yaeyamensis]MBB3698181.1 hypothetical protein [Flammeovirga yaeyamensis]NMF34463.1 hypothetical protein [Flammeovirga yaeyamensis]QWG01442.1 hypothetical protein KMW28_17510 [Flammeovirga yaeyamensis]